MTRRCRVVPAAAAATLLALGPAAAAAANPQGTGAEERSGSGRAADYRLYFGDLHNHTAFSDGATGSTPDDAFDHARASGADWLSTSDHNFMLRQTEWATTKQMAADRTDAGFVAMAGSEYWIASGFGEVIVNNVDELYNKANWRPHGQHLSVHEVPPNFYDWLASHPGAVGHWPHPGLYGDQDDFRHHTPFRDRAMSSIEIHNYGSYLGAPASWGVHDYEPSYVTALDEGWHVLPAAVSDTHAANWISGSPVRTVLLAERLTRPALVDAMRASRGYAVLDDNLRVQFELDGHVMGATLLAGDSTYVAHVRAVDPDGTAADAITRVEVLSDGGEPVASRAFDGTRDDSAVDTRFTLRSTTARYFYVRITTASDVSGGEGVTAWTAPVWTGR